MKNYIVSTVHYLLLNFPVQVMETKRIMRVRVHREKCSKLYITCIGKITQYIMQLEILRNIFCDCDCDYRPLLIVITSTNTTK